MALCGDPKIIFSTFEPVVSCSLVHSDYGIFSEYNSVEFALGDLTFGWQTSVIAVLQLTTCKLQVVNQRLA